jgi:hypothetical protein
MEFQEEKKQASNASEGLAHQVPQVNASYHVSYNLLQFGLKVMS